MKTFRQSKTGFKVVLGMALLAAGVAATLFRRSFARNRMQLEALAREDAEAKSRFDAEGGSMQPVAVS
jgi:hypothetical protein